jgi:hypothetical protein
VHQRRLAGAGRPDDRGQLAARKVEVDAPESVDRRLALAEAPGQAPAGDDRVGRGSVGWLGRRCHGSAGYRRHDCKDAQPVSFSEGSVDGGPQAAPVGGSGAVAIGALAVGAVAIGALAIGALAIGRLAIGRARVRRLRVDELDVGSLRVARLEVKDRAGS